VVAGAPVRQGLQDGPLALDALGVAAADELVDEGAVGGQVGEGGAGAQQTEGLEQIRAACEEG
jgi:hypothetical protein